jgi:hypothetical protein
MTWRRRQDNNQQYQQALFSPQLVAVGQAQLLRLVVHKFDTAIVWSVEVPAGRGRVVAIGQISISILLPTIGKYFISMIVTLD